MSAGAGQGLYIPHAHIRPTIVIRRDGMSVTSVSIERLASQAEEEGITLAEMITRRMSAEDIDEAQAAIHAELARNYTSIEDFMLNLEPASPANLADLSEEELFDLREETVLSLSDIRGPTAEEA